MSALVFIITAALSSVYDSTFTQATQAYEAGDFAKAAQLYEQIVNEGVVDPALFYNLGNAWYRSGNLPQAIANYERALQLAPRFESARMNLDKAVRNTKRGLAKPLPSDWEQSLLFWHYTLRPRTTYLVAALVWLCFWAVLALRQWRKLPYTRMAAAGLLLLGGAFGASAWAKAHPEQLAVAAAETVPVRYGTGDNETVRFELYAGDRVVVDGQMNGWARVVTVDGERGWTHAEHLVFVGPPYRRGAAEAEPEQEAIKAQAS